MGCDIHSFVERRDVDHWLRVKASFPDGIYPSNEPFGWRSYGLFGFLANVRNYSQVPPIAHARGLPKDLSAEMLTVLEDTDGNHSHSYLTLAELLAHDYDVVFWDRRITREIAPRCFDGAATANEGEGEHLTLRAFLGPQFFAHLDILKTIGAPEDVRIVFWFDN